MCSFQTYSWLEQDNHFIGNTQRFIVLDKTFKLIWMDNDVHRSSIGEFIFLGSYTGHTDFFPSFRSVRFLSVINSLTEFFQLNETRGNFRIIFDDNIEFFGSFIKSGIKTSVAYFLAISWIGVGKEVLQLG